MDYLLLSDSLFLFKLICGFVGRCQGTGLSGADIAGHPGVTNSCMMLLISADGKRDTDDMNLELKRYVRQRSFLIYQPEFKYVFHEFKMVIK